MKQINVDQKNNKYILSILIIILLIGCVLRIYGLEIQSLDHGELGDWAKSDFDGLSNIIKVAVRNDLHPPGYFIYLHFIIKYIGDSEIILRATSAICGVFSIYMIYLLGELLYSYKEGLIAAAIMCVSWCPVYYSQSVRSYSMLLLFSMISVYFWYSILQSLRANKKPSLFNVAAYILSSAITSYLHYYGLYFILLQGIAIVLYYRRKRNFLYIIFMYAAILILYLPWLSKLLYQIPHNIDMLSARPTPKLNFFADYLSFFFNDSKKFLYVVLSLYGYLLIYSLYVKYKIQSKSGISSYFSSRGMLLVLWLIIPALGVYYVSISSLLIYPVTQFRYLIICLPAAYLLLARSIRLLPLPFSIRTLITAALIVSLLSHLVFSKQYYTRPHKEQYREAVDFIVKHDQSFINSAIISYVWNTKSLNYYFGKQHMKKDLKIIAGKTQDITNVKEFIKSENPKYIWYISAHRVPDPEFIEYLQSNLQIIENKNFIKAQVLLFKNPNYHNIDISDIKKKF